LHSERRALKPRSFDFFAQQELARRNTRWLVGAYGAAAILVALSYCAVVALAYALLAMYGALPLAGHAPLAWDGLFGTYFDALVRVPPQVLLGVAGIFGAIVLAASAHRAWTLRDGGPAIAHFLGARYVNPDRCAPRERRLLNVVEEMAIASGIAVPPVYLLHHDDAVNALVAGFSPNEAAIVVTQGALAKLSRDELQAVMGHEFSHILNGDMALNLRLACILAGLSWLGDRGEEAVWRAASLARKGDTSSAPQALVGAVLAFIGYPGVLAADAIKAAISRERELLADAASVQFTRNPDGIAGALDSMRALGAHSVVRARHARELSHMFFAPVGGRWWGFPTHPPLETRIRKAHPRFSRDAYRERRHGTRREVAVIDGSGSVVKHLPLAAVATAVLASESIGRPSARHVDYARTLLESIPARLRQALHRPEEAELSMLAVVLGMEGADRAAVLAAIEVHRGQGATASTVALEAHVAGIARAHMLTLAELAVPAIKEQAQKARDRFLGDVQSVIEADRRLPMGEFVLLTFLRQRLREGAGHPIPAQFRRVGDVAGDAQAVLSLVAIAAGGDVQAAYAKGAALLDLAQRPALGREVLNAERMRDALERLRRLAPLAKPALLKACVEVAAADGKLRLGEVELVRMVAATLDCPVPPLIESQDPAALAA
jgi:Zn-dependent protease with chaperone function